MSKIAKDWEIPQLPKWQQDLIYKKLKLVPDKTYKDYLKVQPYWKKLINTHISAEDLRIIRQH
jgi:hypothetical protein